YVAALLRYMQRTQSCDSKYQFLDHAIREIESWVSLKFEDLVLRADAYRTAASYLVPNNPCSTFLHNFFGKRDFEEFAERADENYRKALEMLSSSEFPGENLKTRYSLSIRLQQKYLLNDRSDFAFLTNKRDSIKVAKAALDAGLKLANDKAALPDGQSRVFAPYLSGSNAESYLRLAALVGQQPDLQKELIGKAIDQLRKTITEGDEGAARWAMLRLVDLELSRNAAR